MVTWLTFPASIMSVARLMPSTKDSRQPYRLSNLLYQKNSIHIHYNYSYTMIAFRKCPFLRNHNTSTLTVLWFCEVLCVTSHHTKFLHCEFDSWFFYCHWVLAVIILRNFRHHVIQQTHLSISLICSIHYRTNFVPQSNEQCREGPQPGYRSTTATRLPVYHGNQATGLPRQRGYRSTMATRLPVYHGNEATGLPRQRGYRSTHSLVQYSFLYH